jgi:hypothetical protein
MTEQPKPQPPPSPDLPAVIARQEAVLQHQLDWIRAVDSKTPVVIGVATAMLAVTGALSPAPANVTWVTGVLMAVGSLPLLGSIAWSAAATFPQTTGPRGSMIFFGGIASLTNTDYAKAVAGRSDAQHLDDLNAQCHRNAQIATAKYRAVRHAMGWLFVSTPLWLAACYFLYKG